MGRKRPRCLTPPQEEEAAAALVPDPEELPEPWAQVESEWVEDDPIPFVPLRRRAENLAARTCGGGGRGGDPKRPCSRRLRCVRARAFRRTRDGTMRLPKQWRARKRSPKRCPRSSGCRPRFLMPMVCRLAVVDEAALQEIVRLMIREELKGRHGGADNPQACASWCGPKSTGRWWRGTWTEVSVPQK